MNRPKDMEIFLNIENKYELYDDTIEGINYWVYARGDIWHRVILKNSLGLGVAHSLPQMNVLKILKRVAGMSVNVLKKGKVPLKDVDILFMNHQRRIFNKGYYECVYTDELSSKFENSVVLEHTYQLSHKVPVLTKNLVYTDYVVLKGEISKLLYKVVFRKRYRNLLKQVRQKTHAPLQELMSVYGSAVDCCKIERRIAEIIIEYKAIAGYYEKMISEINPKLLVEVVGYNLDCMIANEVCKRKSIPVIELQHGTMNDHLAYAYFSKKDIKQFPDKIFLFSDFWKEQIQVPIEESSLIVTGFPNYERKKAEAKPILKYMDEKVNILFISQGEIGNELSRLAVGLSKKLDNSRYRIIYKLHPGEYAVWKKNYPWLINEQIEVIDNDFIPLYNYFVSSLIQVGVHSTAIYEGVGFGLHTFIFNTARAERMKALCDMGYAEYITDCGMLLDKIINLKEKKRDTSEFWKENALENMVYNLRKLL